MSGMTHRALAVILVSVVFVAAGRSAIAATLTVNSVTDAVDATPGDGACDTTPPDGRCTLRAAIQEANALPGADEVIVPAGSYVLAIPGQGEDEAAMGDLDIRYDLTLRGVGAAQTIIDGNGLDRVFHVFPRTLTSYDINVWIDGVTIQKGDCRAASCNGGGIFNHRSSNNDSGSALTLTGCSVTHNTSGVAGGGLGGGGIFNASVLTVANSTIDGNATPGWGGGLVAFGCSHVTTLADSTVSGNTADFGGGGIEIACGSTTITGSAISNNAAAVGGGIEGGFLSMSDSTVSGNTARGGGGGFLVTGPADVVRSTFSGNVAGLVPGAGTPDGGGIFMQSITGDLNLTNVTVSGNRVAGKGGGIANAVDPQPDRVNLVNVTITNNVAEGADVGDPGAGGGIFKHFHDSGAPGFAASNTIIAGNLDTKGSGPDCSGKVLSLGHNLIQSPAECVLSGDLTGTIAGLDPRLAPLAANGGHTLTHGLRASSPAIDAGDDATCASADQRGVPRPMGVACDIGAFEGLLPGLTILTESPLLGQVGVPWSDPFEATGGDPPYSWAVVGGSLPDGMHVSADGVLAGSPTRLGTFPFALRVTDGANATAETRVVAEVSLGPPQSLRVDKSGMTAVPGREIVYFIVVRNVGRSMVAHARVMELLEPWFAYVSANPAPSSVESNLLSWEVPHLAPGGSVTIGYTVRLDPLTPLGTTVRGPACAGGLAAVQDLAKGLRACVKVCKEGGEFEGEKVLAGCNVIPDSRGQTACNAQCFAGICEQRTFIDAAMLEAECGVWGDRTVAARDPNEKGIAARRFIRPDQLLVYPIHFENVGTAEARDVFVTDILDADLDASTVEILTPGGAFDAPTRTVRWALRGIDLAPGSGDSLLFAVKPLAILPSGAEIRNSADIQFEVFEPMRTNEVVNVIDLTPPTCAIDPLPAVTTTASFSVTWRGADAVGEIDSYDILISVDGQPFAPWRTSTSATSATVQGRAGRTYGFLCVATDTARNVEPQPLVAEATTTVGADRLPCVSAGDCDDGDACTADTCGSGGGCVHVPLEQGTGSCPLAVCMDVASCEVLVDAALAQVRGSVVGRRAVKAAARLGRAKRRAYGIIARLDHGRPKQRTQRVTRARDAIVRLARKAENARRSGRLGPSVAAFVAALERLQAVVQ